MIIRVFIVAVILARVWGVFWGVDFTDESLYVALSYRFVLGDRPFVDDLSFAQMGGLILAPFFAAHRFFVGSSDGIVLFARMLSLTLSILCAEVIAFSLRPALSRPVSLLAGLLVVTFVPFGISSAGYNTLGAAFFSLGVFLSAATVWRDGAKKMLFFGSGAAHTLAIFVYPSHVISVAFWAIALFAFLARPRTLAMYYIGGGLCAAAALVPALRGAGPSDIAESCRFVLSWGSYGRGYEKWRSDLSAILETAPPYVALIPALAVACFSSSKRPVFAVAAFGLVCAAAGSSGFTGNLGSMGVVIWLGLAAPVYIALEPRSGFRRVAWIIWAGSFAAANVTAWSSSNSGMNAALGIFPAAILGPACFLRSLERSPVSRRTRDALLVAAAAALHLPLVWSAIVFPYRDLPPSAQTERLTDGPFAFLSTTPEKAEFIVALADDLKPFVSEGGNLVAFDFFPAAYLLTPMPPGVCFPWVDVHGRQYFVDSYLKKLREETVTVHLAPITNVSGEVFGQGADDPLYKNVIERQKLVLARPGYSIYAGLMRANAEPRATSSR